jgi:hypothetical protein
MLCPLCICTLATGQLASHMKSYHAVKQKEAKKVLRPKEQVVADWESRHLELLIFPEIKIEIVKMVHSEKTCVDELCSICLNLKLDRLLASTEEDLNATRTSLGVNNELASDIVSKCA